MKDSWLRVTLVLAFAVLALCHWIGLWAVIAFVVLSTMILGAGWPNLLNIPARKTLSAVIAGTGVIAAVVTAFNGPELKFLVPVMALGVVAVFLVQLFRGSGKPHRLLSLLGAASATYIAALGSGWISLAQVDRPEIVYASAATGIFSSIFVGRKGSNAKVFMGVVLGLIAGLLVTWQLQLDWILGALLVVVTAVIVSVLHILIKRSATTSSIGLAAAALSVLFVLGAFMYYLPIIVENNLTSLLAT